jgi:hypothetical protein
VCLFRFFSFALSEETTNLEAADLSLEAPADNRIARRQRIQATHEE